MFKSISKTQFLIQLVSHMAKSKSQVVYIAGKVSGLPVEECQIKFKTAQKKLEAQGFHVLNPCDFISPDEDWQIAMRIATTMLNMADHIYLLPDWNDSEGAKFEFAQAQRFGINTMHE